MSSEYMVCYLLAIREMEQQAITVESQEEREQRLSNEAVATIRNTRQLIPQLLWNSALYGWRYPSDTRVKGEDYCKMAAHILTLVDPNHDPLAANIEYFLYSVPVTPVLHLDCNSVSQATPDNFMPMNMDIEVVSGLTGKLSFFNGMLMCLCRCVNYKSNGRGTTNPGFDGVRRTENWLLFVKDGIVIPYRLQGQKEEWFSMARLGGGLEDLRFVNYRMKDDVLEIVALGSRPCSEGTIARVSMNRTVLHFDGISVKTVHNDRIQYGKAQEKNWITIKSNKDDLSASVIYYYNPLKIITINHDGTVDDTNTIELDNPSLHPDMMLAGGCRPLLIDGRMITFIHQWGYKTLFNGARRRYYYHRIVELDSQYRTIAFSRPLTFLNKRDTIEYILGATIVDGTILLAINNADEEVTLCKLDYQVAFNLLQSAEEWKRMYLEEYVG